MYRLYLRLLSYKCLKLHARVDTHYGVREVIMSQVILRRALDGSTDVLDIDTSIYDNFNFKPLSLCKRTVQRT